MTFLHDLWKKMKAPLKPQDLSNDLAIAELEPEIITQNFAAHETAFLESDKILRNLKAIKTLLEQPKSEKPDKQFEQMQNLLGLPESYETLRQERWRSGIKCPDCYSSEFRRIPQIPSLSAHNHRYQCLNCLLEFTDETGTPIESSTAPLNAWIQCWYLLGFTDSLMYIAERLGLELHIVEIMVEQLKEIFKMQQPNQSLDLEQTEEQSQKIRKQLSEDLLRQFELLDANIAIAPKDTSEFRRQQNLRRNLKASTDPLTPTTPHFTRRR